MLATDVQESIDADRVRTLIDKLGYASEQDLQEIAGVTAGTVQAWRSRGLGPPYVRVGRRRLYPLAGLAKWMGQRARQRQEAESHD